MPQFLKVSSRNTELSFMSFEDYPAARDTKAHQVFLEELENQLSQLAELKVRSMKGEIDRPEEVRRFMHRLKGGAGFFGYNSLQSTAEQIESILEASMQDVDRQHELLGRLLDKLEGLAHTISNSSE